MADADDTVYIGPDRTPALIFVSKAPEGLSVYWDDSGFASTAPRERAVLIGLLRHALDELEADRG